ncbi:MAG: glutamate--cysteine ligase, partial [Burkholderiales bacterium]
KACPDASNLLLIPENHTRNSFYLQNVAALRYILQQAGLNVRLGSLSEEITQPTSLALPDGKELLLEPLRREGNRIKLEGFDPCIVLLNNDLSAGIPGILDGIEQNLLPPLHAGWSTRKKTNHFSAYDQVAAEFAKLLGIDQWLINPYFERCDQINFQERLGEQCLAEKVDSLLTRIRAKYQEYGIQEQPYVIVKANSGTYGMGVMSVKDASEVIGLNRKQRNKMSVIKEGQEVHEVIVQEGVHTFESLQDAVAEPVVYMIDRYVVGGFYRVHTGRGPDENLNAPGMHFEPLAFETACSLPDCGAEPDYLPNRFYAYGVVARLALLAASLEIEQTTPQNN